MKKRRLTLTIAAVLATGGATAQEAIDLDRITSLDGFVIFGEKGGARLGISVSGAGDINGDGFDDVIVGAPNTDPGNPERFNAGSSYVVFGNESGYPLGLNLADLNDSNGFVINGIDEFDYSGRSVSAAGDVNGDGIDDLIIGARGADPGTASEGQSYVVFGKEGGFPVELNLNLLGASDDGFVMNGVGIGDYSGRSVSSAGDVNGDGIDDVIVGAPGADPGFIPRSNAGVSYVVFGTSNGSPVEFDLSTLNGSNGLFLIGDNPDDQSGISVRGAGDINGDGFDDVIVGAPGADPGDPTASVAGKSYVVFGSDNNPVPSVFLSDLNGDDGFVFNGNNPFDYSGQSVSGAGDINGDGIDDLIIGVRNADPGIDREGESYVVFGTTNGFPPSLDRSDLNGTNGFILTGIDPEDRSGFAVSNAGDVNGDGIEDLIIGANGADPGNPQRDRAGESYVVFGNTSGFPATMDLADLNGINGFVVSGIDIQDRSGAAVSGAGDVNGDGIADLIIGAYGADLESVEEGEAYVLFGNAVPKALGSQSMLFEELEDNSDPLGSRLDFSVAAQYIDNNPFGGMAVVADASTSAQGQWEYSDNGLDWTDVPQTLNDSNALVLSAEALLRFVPDANFSGRPGALSARFWDGRWREPGENVDITNAIGAFGGFARDEDLLQVTLDITAVNDAPSFTATNPPTVNEDPGGVSVNNWSSFNPGPGEASQFALTYQVENISNPGLFSVLPTVGTLGNLIYNPAQDVSGTSTFDVRVVDSGGMANGGVNVSGFQTFTVTVNPVNDPPAFLADDPPAVTIDSGAQTVPQWISVDAGAPDEQNQQVTLSVGEVSNPSLFSAAPSIDAAGNLTYTPAAGASGTSGFIVSARDNGGTANGGQDTSAPMEFTIRVTAEQLFSDSFEGSPQ